MTGDRDHGLNSQQLILVLNAGSSSLKLAVFDAQLNKILAGQVSEIGGASQLILGGINVNTPLANHQRALSALLQQLNDQGLPLCRFGAAAHRVVHGGAGLTQPLRLTTATLDEIEACIPLAPLHNPHNLSAIRALAAMAPDLPQTASFDTAFHADNPDVATRYAIPQTWHTKGIRRYGFHGISYAALVHSFGASPPPRLLACHLGNGASLCAIRNGKSVATTMGYSPLDGLTMGTRSGSIDGTAVLQIASELGIKDTAALLNTRSGLLALGGQSDMRALEAADTPETRFAIEHFCYWAARHAGSMIAAMGGIDAIAFTGGIGENATALRDRILKLLVWTQVPPDRVHIIKADEERQIARDAQQLLTAPQPPNSPQ